MTGKLDKKVAIITGAGSGIGKAMAVLFAKEGASVVASDIVSDSIEKVVSEIKDAGGEATGIVGNVANESDVVKMIDTATKTYGRLDILCNNAGIMDNMVPIADVTDELWKRVIGVNLDGPFLACRKAVQIMLEQGGGVILNTASMSGFSGAKAGLAYTVSKHGVVGLTKSIAYMYADKGIRCNAICPGGVATNILTDGSKLNPLGKAKVEIGLATMPRVGMPEDIANVALMMVSDEAGFLNGAVVPVDAGWSAF